MRCAGIGIWAQTLLKDQKFEVPEPGFITQGVSPHLDVDYWLFVVIVYLEVCVRHGSEVFDLHLVVRDVPFQVARQHERAVPAQRIPSSESSCSVADIAGLIDVVDATLLGFTDIGMIPDAVLAVG